MTDILSLEDDEGLRCVDVLRGPDGAFGFKTFRRDPEDGGRWSMLADYTAVRYATREEALRAAASTLAWLRWPVAAADTGAAPRLDDKTENAG